MRKTLALVTVMSLALSFSHTAFAETSDVEETSSESIIAGGWTVNDEIVTPSLTKDSKDAFDKAYAEYTDYDLEPAALLATQVVAGINYLYLCKGQETSQASAPSWYFVVIYQDLSGNAKITSVEELDLTDLKSEEKQS